MEAGMNVPEELNCFVEIGKARNTAALPQPAMNCMTFAIIAVQRQPVWTPGSGSDCCENDVPLYVYYLSANARNDSYTCLVASHARVAPSIQDRCRIVMSSPPPSHECLSFPQYYIIHMRTPFLFSRRCAKPKFCVARHPS
jgi:hypothetical protein